MCSFACAAIFWLAGFILLLVGLVGKCVPVGGSYCGTSGAWNLCCADSACAVGLESCAETKLPFILKVFGGFTAAACSLYLIYNYLKRNRARSRAGASTTIAQPLLATTTNHRFAPGNNVASHFKTKAGKGMVDYGRITDTTTNGYNILFHDGVTQNNIPEDWVITTETAHKAAAIQAQMKAKQEAAAAAQAQAKAKQEAAEAANRPHKATLKSGNTFDGEWRNGIPWGKGVLTMVDGNTVEGHFQNGKRHGRCTVTTALLTQEGGFVEGLSQGTHSISYRNGTKFEVAMVDGKIKGVGILQFPAGHKVRGTFLFLALDPDNKRGEIFKSHFKIDVALPSGFGDFVGMAELEITREHVILRLGDGREFQ